jgi:transcriptional regulator with XRE-family HTH domain
MPVFNHHVLRAWARASQRRDEEICVRAGISYPYLQAIKGGARANPSADVLARLAAAYERPVGELFTDDAETAGAR